MATGGIEDAPFSIGDSTNEPVAIFNDLSIQQISAKFEHDVNITADADLEVDQSEIVPSDSDSSASEVSVKDNDDLYDDSLQPTPLIKHSNIKKTNSHKLSRNGQKSRSNKYLRLDNKNPATNTVEADTDDSSLDTQSIKSQHGCSPIKGKNPLKMLKKLTKFDKSTKTETKDFRSKFSAVSADQLPQVFVVKYLGHREVKGACGLHHVRQPVDEMVAALRTKMEAKVELNVPLLYVIVSSKGLSIRAHHTNKVKSSVPVGSVPIEYISYGVQDIKYWRIFTFIIVRALSSRTRSATCHVVLCDSAQGGRRMALALGAAFEHYSKRLRADGEGHNFKVELRPPDELIDLLECDV